MGKVTLLLLLLLPACVSQEELAQSRAHRLAYIEQMCRGRVGSATDSDLLNCIRTVGKESGYDLISEGQELAFVVPPPDKSPGRIGGGTFYPSTYVPPVNAYR